MKKIIQKNNNKILKTLINKGIPPMGGGLNENSAQTRSLNPSPIGRNKILSSRT